MTEQTLFILASLAGGELHGYGIARDVEELSEGRVTLTAGTLYGALSRLTADGLITESRESVVDGRRRRYYRLTSAGQTALAEEAARLRSIAEALTARSMAAPGRRPRPARGGAFSISVCSRIRGRAANGITCATWRLTCPRRTVSGARLDRCCAAG